MHKGKYYYICPAEFRPQKLSDIGLNSKNEKQRKHCPTCEWEYDHVKVFSGPMFSKEHYYKIFNPNWHKLLKIDDKIIRDYRDDKNRKGFNLLDKKNAFKYDTNKSLKILQGTSEFDFIVPCFYVEDKGVVEHFGANPYYRIPYNQSISDHIPANLRNAGVDFTDAVFGNKECWASRVFFEDIYLQGKADFFPADFVKILMTPNPTSFQFYLNPEDGEPRHWDENSDIRGFKFYWHKEIKKWQYDGKETAPEKIATLTKRIAPLKENQTFTGKIRFQNLDAVELGALAQVLSICETADQCFKLGMGKPIGMGTIKLTAKLYLQDKNYYTNLFSDDNFYTGSSEQNKNDFVTKFKAYIKNNLSNQSWQIYEKRLADLNKILSTKYMEKDNDKIVELTHYMDINNRQEGKIVNSRKPLPTIDDILKKFNSPK